MACLRASLLFSGFMAAATPALAGPNLVQNGDFSSYTNNNGQSNPNIGFEADYNGTVTGWSSGGVNNPYYNFLFLNGTAQNPAAETGAWSSYGYLGLWDANNSGGANTWNGNGPTGVASNFMALDGDFGTGPVSQTITGLTKGSVYAVTFYYAFAQQEGFTGPTTQGLTVGLGSSAKSVPLYNLPSQGFSGWMQETFYLEADSSSDALSFLAFGNVQLPPFALISDISMVDAPEPSAWAVMGIGLLGLVGAARMRRAKVAPAGIDGAA